MFHIAFVHPKVSFAPPRERSSCKLASWLLTRDPNPEKDIKVLRAVGYRIRGLGFRVWVWGFGFGFWVWVWGLGFGFRVSCFDPALGVLAFGVRV